MLENQLKEQNDLCQKAIEAFDEEMSKKESNHEQEKNELLDQIQILEQRLSEKNSSRPAQDMRDSLLGNF